METEEVTQGLDIKHISAMLSAAGIDHKADGEFSLYVTGLSFNLWIRPDLEDEAISISTHWPFLNDVDELSALRFINQLNCSKILVQFAFSEAHHQMQSHAWLSCKDGLSAPQLIRTALRFSGIFNQAVTTGRLQNLIGDEPEVGFALN